MLYPIGLQPGGQLDHGHQRADDEAALVIFSEVVSMHVKPAGRDEFMASITVRLRPDNATHPRNLLLELTDESDFLFYHSLVLGEGDFHALKAEQRLRVDFQGFPSQLVELLRRCMVESSSGCGVDSDGPARGSASTAGDAYSGGATGSSKMLAHLDCTSHGDSLFSIVESNLFRELTHIALRLRQGTDEVVKQHLAGKLRGCRAEAADLAERLRNREEQLERAKQQADELAARARVVGEERVHLERSLDATHQRELAELRQEHARALSELQRSSTEERARLESDLRQNLTAAQDRATRAERLNEDLQHRQQSLTSSGKSCQERLDSAEAQLRNASQEAQTLREQVKELELLKFQHERMLGELRMQVSGLREQLGVKEQLTTNQAAQIEQAASQRRALEESLAACKQQAHALEEKFALSAQEITKGNQIIHNLHAGAKQAKAKLKLKSSEAARHEKALLDFERTEELSKRALEEKENEVARGREREERLQQDAEELKKKLAEAHEVLKTNQEVIEYLNRQLTERDLKGIPSVQGLLGTLGGVGPEADLLRRADGMKPLGGSAAGQGGGLSAIASFASTSGLTGGLVSTAGLCSTGGKGFNLGLHGFGGSLPLGGTLALGGSSGSLGTNNATTGTLPGASPPRPTPALASPVGVGASAYGGAECAPLRGPVAYRSPGLTSPNG
mmetsp:Transcript_74720/g.207754  ORF Transcript_74720/g.207754 Transcript_74720/m.207754 type:complete len:682 (+) Transcript_74720:159-2204(+)